MQLYYCRDYPVNSGTGFFKFTQHWGFLCLGVQVSKAWILTGGAKPFQEILARIKAEDGESVPFEFLKYSEPLLTLSSVQC